MLRFTGRCTERSLESRGLRHLGSYREFYFATPSSLLLKRRTWNYMYADLHNLPANSTMVTPPPVPSSGATTPGTTAISGHRYTAPTCSTAHSRRTP